MREVRDAATHVSSTCRIGGKPTELGRFGQSFDAGALGFVFSPATRARCFDPTCRCPDPRKALAWCAQAWSQRSRPLLALDLMLGRRVGAAREGGSSLRACSLKTCAFQGVTSGCRQAWPAHDAERRRVAFFLAPHQLISRLIIKIILVIFVWASAPRSKSPNNGRFRLGQHLLRSALRTGVS